MESLLYVLICYCEDVFFCKCWIFFGGFYVEYKVHSYNRNGLCALGFMDDHYPVRSAFSLLNQVNPIFMALLSLFFSKEISDNWSGILYFFCFKSTISKFGKMITDMIHLQWYLVSEVGLEWLESISHSFHLLAYFFPILWV